MVDDGPTPLLVVGKFISQRGISVILQTTLAVSGAAVSVIVGWKALSQTNGERGETAQYCQRMKVALVE